MISIKTLFKYSIEKIIWGFVFWFFLFLFYFLFKEHSNIKFDDINFIDIINILLALTLSIYIPIAIWKSLEIRKDKKTLFINEIESYEKSIHELVKLVTINDSNLSFDNKKELVLLHLRKIWNNKKLIKDKLGKYFPWDKVKFDNAELDFHELYWYIAENLASWTFTEFSNEFNKQTADLASNKISSLLDIKFGIIEY